jgi:hypothetical protein
MNNADMPAMPIFDNEAKLCIVRNPDNGKTCLAAGLTKREHFAGLAMQGLLSNSGLRLTNGEFIGKAVTCADALLAELDRTKQ